MPGVSSLFTYICRAWGTDPRLYVNRSSALLQALSRGRTNSQNGTENEASQYGVSPECPGSPPGSREMRQRIEELPSKGARSVTVLGSRCRSVSVDEGQVFIQDLGIPGAEGPIDDLEVKVVACSGRW